MKQTIRYMTFETNSSSTHNMVVIPEKYIEQWDKDELFYIDDVYGEIKELVEKNNGRLLYTRQELEEAGIFDDMPKREDFEDEDEYNDEVYDYLDNSDLLNKSKWESRELEFEETVYTTESGEKLHIMCQHGYGY